ncbi:conserved exported hypothetical protein [Flavobacterium sp. 9AF]|uniref:DUF6565 domain-containing protein n=1 Tax=Flavobacterium sp. 9AF TaxID=2653142 RepID=UPI0012F4032A|nr:DUF6565 domain-containing protein [Flavobacterium sp. 9AF]VXC06694.1 conserved exported hypothetical protein [Flavobacterium sp. 9AF]
MKNLKITLGLFALAVSLTACTDEKKLQAEKDVAQYANYVDSISNIEMQKAANEWDAIQKDYERLKMNAENSLTGVEDDKSLKESIDNTSVRYEEYKVKVVTEKEKVDAENAKMSMRKTLLGDGYNGQDMNFDWVNKDNILSVYENFVTTVEKNKDSYSREDWDEIKLMYEALDTRKNTVEKEGLTSEDNRKIAGLKIKFAPMYTVNRIGAKSEENEEAKQ